MLAQLRETLHKPRVIRFQLEFALNTMYAYSPLVANYRKHFEPSSQPELAARSAPLAGPDFSSNFKVLPRVRVFYNIWQLYAIFRGLMPQQLEWLIASLFAPERPARCYLLGGFTLERTIDASTSLVYCAVFLSWSMLQRVSLRDYTCAVVYFLLSDERQIGHFESLVGRQQVVARDEPARLEPGLRQRIEGQHRLLSAIMLNTLDKIHAPRPKLKLRPTRSLAARECLIDLLVSYNTFWIVVISSIVVLITSLTLIQILLDRRYLQAYPMCQPQIDQLYADKPLEFWSITVTPLRAVEAVLIGVENIIIWTEIGFVSSFGWVQIALINHDLMAYWRFLHHKIALLAREARYRSNIALATRAMLRPAVRNDRGRAEGSCSNKYLLDLHKFSLEIESSTELVSSNKVHSFASYDEQICELQNDIYDFFLQMRQSDRPIQNIVLLYFGLWSIVFPVQSYYLKTIYGENHSLAVYLFQVALFIIVLSVSCQLWLLSRLCRSSYQTLCTLVAYDYSTHTQRFLPIVGYFGEELFYFQIFNRIAFKPTLFMSIIGWSISANLILESIARR